MRTNAGKVNPQPTSSNISDSVADPNVESSNNLNGKISGSLSSSSSETIGHDEDTAKQVPTPADATAADTTPGITVVASTLPPPQSSTVTPKEKLRPRLGSRRSSGTIIIPRDSEVVEVDAEVYDEGDARAMSPPRSTEEVDKMTEEARAALTE